METSEILFEQVMNSSPTGLWLSDTNGGLIYLNKTLIDWTGLPLEELLGAGWTNAIIEEDRSRSASAFQEAISARGHYDVMFRLKKATGEIIWCRAAGDPYNSKDGRFAGYSGYCMDMNDLVTANSKLKVGDDRFRGIVEQAPMAIGLLRGRDMVIEVGNGRIFDVWGKDKSVTGKRLIDALPEIKDQMFLELLEEVYTTGKPYFGDGVLAKLQRNNRIEEVYFDFAYTPLRESDDSISGVMVLATEVTQQVLARKAIENSEARFRSLIEEAPFATALYVGHDLIIEMANPEMIKVWGKDSSVIGKQLHVALPELDGQPFIEILQNVFTTGVAYHDEGALVDLVVNGQRSSFYFNFSYKPLRNSEGEVYSILNMAVDVTEQMLSRQQIEDAEELYRGAVELAQLATWSMDIETGQFTYSPRFMEWLGFTEQTKSMDEAYNPLPVEYRDQVAKAIADVITPNSSGVYENEHPIINKRTGQERTIHAQGRVFYNKDLKRAVLAGTAQDVTRQRSRLAELEEMVQLRTEELASANEELQSSNEEMYATNEELSEANQKLVQSNQHLEQYAYIASHDLQEPLRKIRTFTDRLIRMAGDSGEIFKMSHKIHQSAERMSILIADLLEFSRATEVNALIRPTSLSDVVRNVMTDFELVVEEKKSTIHIGQLPVIQAVPLHMNQLFYNLLNNAFKFSKKNEPPVISVESSPLTEEEKRKYRAYLLNSATYHHIRFSDNGIGFEQAYSEHVFEIFKRLHSRDEYPGSGIGLALCRRIVNNHNGHMYVESEPGRGTTFHLLLPVNVGT